MDIAMTAPADLDALAREARERVRERDRERARRRAGRERALGRALAAAGRTSPTRAATLACSAVLLGALLSLARPVPARAGLLETITDTFGGLADFASNPIGATADLINGAVCAWLRAAVVSMLGEGYTILSRVSLTMTSDFTNLMGSGTGLYGLVHTANMSVIQPIAISIFGVVMLLRLIDIAGKFDGSNAMPGLREIFMFGCFVFLFETLILNSEGMFWGIFQIAQGAADKLVGTYRASLSDLSSVRFTFSDDLGANVGAMLPILAPAFLFYVCAMIASYLASIMFLARALQIYLMTAFSSIGFALLGSDHTRQMGIGFIRSYVGVCLDGFTLAFIILAFPIALTSMASTGDVLIVDGASLIRDTGGVCSLSFLLLWSLLHSSQWTREILGA